MVKWFCETQIVLKHSEYRPAEVQMLYAFARQRYKNIVTAEYLK